MKKNDAELDAKWTSAVRTISEDTRLPPAIIALQPFLASPRFSQRARITAIQLAVNGKDPVFFNELLAAAFSPARWSNVDDLVAIDRGLAIRNETFAAETHQRYNGTYQVGWNAADIADDRYLSQTLLAVSAQIVSVLRTPPPSGFHLDLSRTFLREADLSGTDLRDTSLEGTRLYSADLAGANLAHVTKFLGLDAYETAWWEAQALNPALLQYLQNTSPCDPKKRYGADINSAKSYTASQCQASLAHFNH